MQFPLPRWLPCLSLAKTRNTKKWLFFANHHYVVVTHKRLRTISCVVHSFKQAAYPLDFLLTELVTARHVGERAGWDKPRIQQLEGHTPKRTTVQRETYGYR